MADYKGKLTGKQIDELPDKVSQLSQKVGEIEQEQTTVKEIKEVMETLPDGSAVSAQVALNTTDIRNLDTKGSYLKLEYDKTQIEWRDNIEINNGDVITRDGYRTSYPIGVKKGDKIVVKNAQGGNGTCYILSKTNSEGTSYYEPILQAGRYDYGNKSVEYTVESDGYLALSVSNYGDASFTVSVYYRKGLNYWGGEIQKVIAAIDKVQENNDVIARAIAYLEKKKSSIYNIVDVNADKEQALRAMRYKNTTPTVYEKALTMAWVSDVHGDIDCWKRFVEYVNHYKEEIDCVLMTGDLNQISDYDYGWYDMMEYAKENCEIPILPVLGNHDICGNGRGINQTLYGTQSNVASRYITPYLTSNFVQGEDADGNKQSYWYYDLPEYKIRVLGINDYDMPVWVGTNSMSKAIPPTEAEYANKDNAVHLTDQTALVANTLYEWRGMYFKVSANMNFLPPTTSSARATDDYGKVYNLPCSGYGMYGRYISQSQVDFIVNALKTMPDGYSLVTTSHMALDNDKIVAGNSASEYWTSRSAKGNTPVNYSQNGYILQDILSAWINRTTINKTYQATQEKANTPTGAVISDWKYPFVNINANFSASKGTYACHLFGHVHNDVALWSSHLTSQKQVLQIGAPNGGYLSFMVGRPNSTYTDSNPWRCGDIYKGGIKKDMFNVVSIGTFDKVVKLLRIGADVTDDMKDRKYTSISYIQD